MKQLIKILFVALLAVPFGSCEMTYDPVVVLPNVSLDNSGLTRVTTISSYETDKYTVVLNRTEGLSKPADFIIAVDQAALDQYNELNGSDYTLMPSSLYTIGATELSFAHALKTASFDITFKPSAILAQAGSIAAAEKMIIPFVCKPTSEINSSENKLTSLVRVIFDEPKVTVDAPAEPQKLVFIAGVAIPRELELVCLANFTTLEQSKISRQSTQQMVDDYNTAEGTSHVILPESAYSIDNGTFDQETLGLVYGISVDGSALNPEDTYLLPVKLTSSDYTIFQDNIYYIEVSVQEIKITVKNTDRYQAATKLKHAINVEVELNGALNENVPVVFTYDANLIADYNTQKGKTYEAIDASKISIAVASIVAGSLNATVTIEVDMTDVAFDDGKAYVLPFVIDQDQLPTGAQIVDDDNVVYVRLKRTLYGLYSNVGSDNYVTGVTGWTQKNNMWATTYYNQDYLNEKYVYTNNYWTWARGFHWYVDWDENYQGEPDKRVVHAYSSVTSGFNSEQMISLVIDHGSYFDMVEGKVWFNYQYFYNQSDIDKDIRQTIKCYLESPLTTPEF